MNVNGQSSRVHAYMNNHCAQLNNGVRALNNGARAGLHLFYINTFLNFHALGF